MKTPLTKFETLTDSAWAIALKRERSLMTNTYKIRYQRKGKEGETITTLSAPNPVSALNSFHRDIQTKANVGAKDYKILSFALYYNNDSTGRGRGEWVESKYDMPASDNPDLGKVVKPVEAETEAMPFLASTPTREIT